jgi:hypothetical protein
MDSSSSNRPRSASSFESNTHFNIESIMRDPDRRSFLNSALYVKPAFHTLLRTKSIAGFVRQSNRSAKGEASKEKGSGANLIIMDNRRHDPMRWSCFDGQQCCLEYKRHDYENLRRGEFPKTHAKPFC